MNRSYYDGQMPVEEDSVVTGTSSVTRNFVGARGIEAIFTTTTSGTTTAFPLYDCHGNMVATVARSGAGFVTSNVRTYDVWGGVRTGASTGGPKGRYVANLGHVQDDESGLIYMRARYYEPESGRFISEDSARYGLNWYGYSRSSPVNFTDVSGNSEGPSWLRYIGLGFWLAGLFYVESTITLCALAFDPASVMAASATAGTAIALMALGMTFIGCSGGDIQWQATIALDVLALFVGGYYGKIYMRMVAASVADAACGSKTIASVGVGALLSYSLLCMAALLSMDLESSL